jgi:hypothetical protein
MSEQVVTPEEFARYADKHLGEFACEVCHTKGWALLLDPSQSAGPSYTVKRNSDEGISFSTLLHINSCVVSCKNCGNVKLFLRDRVEEWLKENPNG